MTQINLFFFSDKWNKMKNYYFYGLVFFNISVLSFGCHTSQQNFRAESIANCKSKIGKLFYLNNNARNCRCLFDELIKAGFTEKEIQWYTELNVLGTSKLKEANLTQEKVKKHLNKTSLLFFCGIERGDVKL